MTLNRRTFNIAAFIGLLLHLAAWIAAGGLSIGIGRPRLNLAVRRDPRHFLFFGQEISQDFNAVISLTILATLILTALILACWVIAKCRELLHQATLAQRTSQGLCPTCGYDLRASPSRCPECGAPNSQTLQSPNS